MKNGMILAGLGAAILAGAAGQGIAQDMQKAMGHGMRPGFEELDADGDGKVTRDEMQAHMQARFGAADTDGDGKLSRAELSARIEARQAERRERRLDRMFDRHDTDGDGALSMDEMRGDRAGPMFSRLDADDDGAVSKEEFERMRERHRGYSKGRGGERGHMMHDDGYDDEQD